MVFFEVLWSDMYTMENYNVIIQYHCIFFYFIFSRFLLWLEEDFLNQEVHVGLTINGVCSKAIFSQPM